MNPRPFFPARPVNGGPLEKARPKLGEWLYEPKFNGWRALIHVPTLTAFNRHGEILTIGAEFQVAMTELRAELAKAQNKLILSASHGRERLIAQEVEWADTEALERRHNRGQGSLVLLDLPMLDLPTVSRGYVMREIFCPAIDHCAARNTVYSVPQYTDGPAAYAECKAANKMLGVEFYEGVVAKRQYAEYPMNNRTGDQETPKWMKHRWAW